MLPWKASDGLVEIWKLPASPAGDGQGARAVTDVWPEAQVQEAEAEFEAQRNSTDRKVRDAARRRRNAAQLTSQSEKDRTSDELKARTHFAAGSQIHVVHAPGKNAVKGVLPLPDLLPDGIVDGRRPAESAAMAPQPIRAAGTLWVALAPVVSASTSRASRSQT